MQHAEDRQVDQRSKCVDPGGERRPAQIRTHIVQRDGPVFRHDRLLARIEITDGGRPCLLVVVQDVEREEAAKDDDGRGVSDRADQVRHGAADKLLDVGDRSRDQCDGVLRHTDARQERVDGGNALADRVDELTDVRGEREQDDGDADRERPERDDAEHRGGLARRPPATSPHVSVGRRHTRGDEDGEDDRRSDGRKAHGDRHQDDRHREHREDPPTERTEPAQPARHEIAPAQIETCVRHRSRRYVRLVGYGPPPGRDFSTTEGPS